ncbi:hypothetical protein J6R97_00220 [bacterium]|nr:hypothetical protein [bacterium]
MGLNITHTMQNSQFENRENLRQTAKKILNRKGASEESVKKIIDDSIFNTNSFIKYNNLSTKSQISIENTIKERLRRLKEQPDKVIPKKPVLGELWEIASKDSNKYNGELIDFEIDLNAENIFAAA